MQTRSNNDEIILGRGKGYKILNAIKNAKKSVKIVSPYLSPSYIKELVRLSEKGISITLITCDELEENQTYSDFKHSDVIKQKKVINQKAMNKKRILKQISLIILLLSLGLFVFSFIIQEVFYFSIPLLIISIIMLLSSYFIRVYSFTYYSLFRLKVFDSKSGEKPWSTNLIHSKIFLVDDKILFLGSANFTYSAFKTHYESIIKVEDPRAIKDISKEVENIFNSTELKSKDIQEFGREIYG